MSTVSNIYSLTVTNATGSMLDHYMLLRSSVLITARYSTFGHFLAYSRCYIQNKGVWSGTPLFLLHLEFSWTRTTQPKCTQQHLSAAEAGCVVSVTLFCR